MSKRFGRHDVARRRMEQLLGFIGAGGAHDIPRIQFGLQRRIINRMHVAVQLAGTIEFAENTGDAAGTVHSDIARGFIRAEVNSYDELIAANGSFADLRAKGQLRLEGKEYVVQDGEVCHFRFNVAK